jgi:hypothetical protein
MMERRPPRRSIASPHADARSERGNVTEPIDVFFDQLSNR